MTIKEQEIYEDDFDKKFAYKYTYIYNVYSLIIHEVTQNIKDGL